MSFIPSNMQKSTVPQNTYPPVPLPYSEQAPTATSAPARPAKPKAAPSARPDLSAPTKRQRQLIDLAKSIGEALSGTQPNSQKKRSVKKSSASTAAALQDPRPVLAYEATQRALGKIASVALASRRRGR